MKKEMTTMRISKESHVELLKIVGSIQSKTGKPIISLNGVSDPHGLRRLVLSTKKVLYPKKRTSTLDDWN